MDDQHLAKQSTYCQEMHCQPVSRGSHSSVVLSAAQIEVAQHTGAPAYGCGPIDAYAELVQTLNQVQEVQGPSSVRAFSHQGLLFELVTSQVSTIITGFAWPGWKDSHLNVGDASEMILLP